MSADEGTIIHTIAYVIGGTFRWLFHGRGLSYSAFLKEPRESKKNMRYGYLIFFLFLIGISLFWYFAFRPGK